MTADNNPPSDAPRKAVLRIRIPKFGRPAVIKAVLLAALVGLAALLGAGYGAWRAIRQDLPSVAGLESFEANIITRVFADDGQPIKDFATERRIEVPYEQIPDVLKKAIIATEDPRFFSHHGIDYRGVVRALKENLKLGRSSSRLQGGSTITQQLARVLFLYPQQTVSRKLKEMYLSTQIEKHYSKEKILEMYCNQFYLNHGVYGVEAASNFYFGKSVSGLTLEEAALIAGIFRGPSVYSPYTNIETTLRRRNHVLSRMLEEGFITRAQEEEARAKPMAVLPWHRGSSDFAAYFFEEVRRYIDKKYGSEALYHGGLKVYTTLSPALQKHAEDALLGRLRAMDKQKGWRKDKKNLVREGKTDLDAEWLSGWATAYATEGEVTDAIVLSVSRTEASVRVKRYTGRMLNKEIAWTRTDDLTRLIQRGDIIQVKVKTVDEAGKTLEAVLDQEPLLEGAFLAVEPRSGQIKAMIGGYSFQRSEWNRATQAARQAGSAIKPLLYTAALENRFTAATPIEDLPVTFADKWLGQDWSPKNYDLKFKGTVTLRIGIEESRNVVTARMLDFISPQTGVDYCRRFGLSSTIYPYLSLALGTFEVSLSELVSAFTVFPNKGVRLTPYFITRIEDREGRVLEEAKVEAAEVIPPQTAYLMTHLLEGVVQRGTAASAASLGIPLAGKTGTTSDFTDAWFIGFSPSLCAGVWVGYDLKMSIGNRQSGAVAALPAWIEFFKAVIKDEEGKAAAEGREPAFGDFEVPPNINFVEIDRKTGLLATPACLWPIREAFLAGTEPDRYCSRQDHMKILDYYGAEQASEEHD
jgi:penicillin-binding protein 1A